MPIDPDKYSFAILISLRELHELIAMAAKNHAHGYDGALDDVALLCSVDVPQHRLNECPMDVVQITVAGIWAATAAAQVTLGRLGAQQLTDLQREAVQYLAGCLALLAVRMRRYEVKDGLMAQAHEAENEAHRALVGLYKARTLPR